MNSDRIFEPLFNAKLNASIRGGNQYSDSATTNRTFDSRDLPSCERGYMPCDSKKRHRQASLQLAFYFSSSVEFCDCFGKTALYFLFVFSLN